MTDKKILFGRAVKEAEIENIDELRESVTLEENFATDEVVTKILMTDVPLDMAVHASSVQSECEIPNKELKDADG